MFAVTLPSLDTGRSVVFVSVGFMTNVFCERCVESVVCLERNLFCVCDTVSHTVFCL